MPREHGYLQPKKEVSFTRDQPCQHLDLRLLASRMKENTFLLFRGFSGGSVVKNLPMNITVQETWVQSLIQEDPTCLGGASPVNRNY